MRVRASQLRLSVSAQGPGLNRHPPPPNNSFKPTPCRGVGCVLYATLARIRRPATGRLNSGVSHMRPILIALVVSALLGSCQAQDNATSLESTSEIRSTSTKLPPPPQDFGDISHFNGCKALPRRTLSMQEQCEVRLLFNDCTKAADCLVTCTMSPDGHRVGGGCYHICFSPITQLKWSERPDIDFSECDKFSPPLSG